jgi:hypothetical protein
MEPPPPPPPPPPGYMSQPRGVSGSLSAQISSTAQALAANFAQGISSMDDRMYSEKSTTGFVGLGNQGNFTMHVIAFLSLSLFGIEGATCYMNSLIQSFYMTPDLRHAIYKV